MVLHDGWKGLRRHRVVAAMMVLGMVVGCAPTRYVHPLEAGELAITGTLGGPVFDNFGYPLPVPNTTVGVGYGIMPQLTGYACFYPTSAAFGVLQGDVGAVYGITEPRRWRPGVSLSPTLNLAGDVWEGRFKAWPQLDANAYWTYGHHLHILYAGLSSWYELAGRRAHGQEQPQFILPGFQVGHVLRGKRLDLTVELKANNVTKSNRDLTVSWWGLGSRGAVGIYLGLTRRFGGK